MQKIIAHFTFVAQKSRRQIHAFYSFRNAKFPYRNLNCKTASEDDYSCKNRPRPSLLAPMISLPPARKSKTLISTTSANKQTKEKNLKLDWKVFFFFRKFKQKRDSTFYFMTNKCITARVVSRMTEIRDRNQS